MGMLNQIDHCRWRKWAYIICGNFFFVDSRTVAEVNEIACFYCE